MEPVLFYGVPHGCSFGSIVALEWLGEPYRLSRIDMLSGTEGELYGRVNVLRQTPSLLLEDGESLTESLAILQNIAGRDLKKFLGFQQGTREFDRLNAMLSYLHTSVHGAFAPNWTAFKMEDGAPGRDMFQALGREHAAKAYAHLEALLDSRAWLMGDHRTVADAYFIGVARWGEDLELFDLEREYPRVSGLLQRLEADRAVVFAHAIEDGKPATTSGQFRGHVSLEDLTPRFAA